MRLFSLSCQRGGQTEDFGVIFLETINCYNLTPHLARLRGTNPYKKQSLLLAYKSCNFSSINLTNFVKNGQIDWSRLTFSTNSKKIDTPPEVYLAMRRAFGRYTQNEEIRVTYFTDHK